MATKSIQALRPYPPCTPPVILGFYLLPSMSCRWESAAECSGCPRSRGRSPSVWSEPGCSAQEARCLWRPCWNETRLAQLPDDCIRNLGQGRPVSRRGAKYNIEPAKIIQAQIRKKIGPFLQARLRPYLPRAPMDWSSQRLAAPPEIHCVKRRRIFAATVWKAVFKSVALGAINASPCASLALYLSLAGSFAISWR